MMEKDEISADRQVDRLYAGLRGRYGRNNSRANGYRYEGFFRREQQILLSLLNPDAAIVVDVACGSGLMAQPLVGRREFVLGVDFNGDACRAARANGLPVVRGDAFRLPFADRSIDEMFTCQFFNQQRPVAVRQFVLESARVLRPRGRVVMVWRNGAALVHRVALHVLGALDRMRGRPLFPHEDHSFTDVRAYAAAAGLEIRLENVSFPPLGWRSGAVDSLPASVLGASNICILEKPA